MSQYRFDKLATETVAWTGTSGKALAVTVRLVQEMTDYYGNGDYTPTRDGLQITLTPAVDDKAEQSTVVTPIKPQGALIAHIGTIGLTAERLAAIRAAIESVKQHPAWLAKTAAIAAAEIDSREYHAHVAAVDHMMTLGGKTY